MRNKWFWLAIAGIVIVAGVIIYLFPKKSQAPQSENTVPSSGNIKVTSPPPNSAVSSPLSISGSARGSWYFEAVFPIKLLDSAGNVIAQTQGRAQGDWMTSDFVPFTATLNFTAPRSGDGMLVLEKDNPSGLPQNDDLLKIPVRFH